MAKFILYSLFGILLLINVNKCRGKPSEQCEESNYPVCATNGTNLYFFKNICRLKSENKNREDHGLSKLDTTDISNCFKHCNQVCSDEYAPLCATCEDDQKTFLNRCEFDLENCRYGNNWKFLHEGQCPSTVPLHYHQSNPQVQPSQIPYVQDRPHPQQQTSPLPAVQPSHQLPIPLNSHEEPVPIPFIINRRCPTHCTLEYDPICATFGGVDQTFDNQCYMRADICRSKRAWVVVHQGECTEPESERCNSNCPKIYSPVCATLNGQNKTFANECVLESEICVTSNSWDFLHTGECRDPTSQNCPKICPNIFIPVCATFNGIQKGFPNQCYVLIEACKSKQDWKIVHEGQCKRPQEPTTSLCPSNNDQPICATLNGLRKTFANKCQMDSESANTNQAWTILGPGECNILPPNAQPQPPYNPPPFTRRPFLQPTFVQPTLAQQSSEQPIPSDSTLACPDCSNVYNPVCGFFNGQQQTFNNECHLLAENCYTNTKWIVGHEGKCHSMEPPRNCPNICPLNYDPVCATLNGVRRTFPNECELNHEAYKTNNQWVILNIGECDYCPVCPDDIAPVCAEFNGQSLTFDNICKVEAENCRTNSGWKIVSKNACGITDCPSYCPRIYIPVCAISNGEARTFGNVCEMKHEACSTNTAWHIVSKGECPSGPNENCPQSCSLQYNPVCAVYQEVSKEFINACFLRSEICKTHINWEFVNAGPCVNHNHTPTQASVPEPITQIPITKPEPDCNVSKCLDFRDPVCATLNGEEKTFSNACYLHNLKCKTGEDWKIIKHDSCRNASARRRRFPNKDAQ